MLVYNPPCETVSKKGSFKFETGLNPYVLFHYVPNNVLKYHWLCDFHHVSAD